MSNGHVKVALAVFLGMPLLAQNGSVVISQIYGGGGNAGAPLRANFIELFNRGSSVVSLSGWSVQYASASGTTWVATNLSGTIQPSAYYLVEENIGAVGQPLPAPDAMDSINLSAISGKVALAASQVDLTGSVPVSTQLVDFVGYGAANAAEASPAPMTDNLTAVLRRSNGCIDTKNNSADFVLGLPAPRNSLSPRNPCSPVQTGVISAVKSASDFGGFPVLAPGTWVEIYGSNLASTPAQSWTAADFTGNNAPTSLGGIQVIVGGQNAFVDYISAGQINAQLPSNVGTGPQQMRVINGMGASAPFNITVNSTQPGLLASPAFKIGATQYAVALLPDGTYVLPPGSIANLASRQAAPGETIVLYGIGFGPVTPDIPAGRIVAAANQLVLPFQILIGQTPVQLSYFGLAPNFVGLYQFNVVVPAVAASDRVPLTFQLGGVPGAQPLFIAVR